MDPGPATQRLMNARELDRSIRRLAQEITERLGDPSGFALVGIVRGGAALAERLAQAIERQEGARPETGSLDITLYRDDLYTGIEKPVLGETRLPSRVGGRTLVLVDDVLFTGRTVRAALDALNQYGRPSSVQLAVMIDRGHRELPIRPDYVGKNLPTGRDEDVSVSPEGVTLSKKVNP